MTKTKVNIQKLKNFAFKRLPKPFALRDILLSEENELEVSVLLARLPLYLKLSRFRVHACIWFSEVDGIDIANFSGVHYWSTDYPTREDLRKLPSARIAGYMGSPRSDDTFKIKGLHVLEVDEECRKIVKAKGGKYGEFISGIERGTLPSYVDSKLVEREGDEVKLTHLRMSAQFFSSTFSTVHLLSIKAGIHQT